MELIFAFIGGAVLAGVAVYMLQRGNVSQAREEAGRQLAEAEHRYAEAEQRERQRYDEMLRQQQEAQERAKQDTDRLHAEALERIKEQLKNETKDILRQRQEEFSQTSKERLDVLLSPLKQDLENMRTSVDKNKEKQIQLQTSMETRIEELLKQTNLTAESANTLADALKNRGKVHGDWSERVLEEILEESGLREGVEFEKQSVVRGEEEANMRPDVIIHFPEGKNMIIDSKASLTAYTDALEAQTDEQRREAVKRHCESIRRHVKELTDKRYQNYVDNAMPYVLMFIPNEGAYVMALNENPRLLQEAYRQGVIIVNPTNLMMTLHLVLIAWQQTRQEDNCRRIIEDATKMYEKMITVVDSFTTMGAQLSTVSTTYNRAMGQLAEGRGNLLRQMESLKELGVTSTKKRAVSNSRKKLAAGEEEESEN